MCMLLSPCFAKSDGIYVRIMYIHDHQNVTLWSYFFFYKTYKLANIYLPKNINRISYNKAIKEIQYYVNGKKFKVMFTKENHVDLFYKNMYVNNHINNILLYHAIIYNQH